LPYRHAHFYLLLLFPLTALAFWPNYLSAPRSAPHAFHVHGVTASLWILLLIAQSWTIHARRNALHRSLGYGSFVLYPLFLTGGLLVLQTMAEKFAAGADPFYAMFGARLGIIDTLASLAIAWFFFQALRLRRKVHLHARYMLATVFFLIAPILSRLMPALPPLAIAGPADFGRFSIGFHIANALAILIALLLAYSPRKHGRPMLELGGALALQSLLYETLGRTAAWQGLYAGLASVPEPLLVALGIATGAAIVWLGWSAAPPRRPAAAP
jgi:hypothetical protein